jgi:hypothetical protein
MKEILEKVYKEFVNEINDSSTDRGILDRKLEMYRSGFVHCIYRITQELNIDFEEIKIDLFNSGYSL